MPLFARRPQTVACLLAMFVLGPAARAGAAPGEDISAVGPADYQRAYQSAIDATAVDRKYDAAGWTAKARINFVAEVAFDEAKLWRATGDEKYAALAVADLNALADTWLAARAAGKPVPDQDGFFLAFPLFAGYQVLDAGGKIDASLRDRLRRVAIGVCGTAQRGNFNQPLARAAGQAMAAKVFPDVPQSAQWRKDAQAVWDDWFAGRDTTENALNYNGIFLTYAFELADLLGHTAEMNADPAVRATYGRFRDQVSPSGVTPGYGDSGELGDWPFFVAAFERAAVTWHDPTFRWAATRMFDAGMKVEPPVNAGNANLFFPLALACDWADPSVAPRVPELSSAVLHRFDPRDPAMADKLILGPSRSPGAPFLVSDLYAAQAGHAYPEWGGMHAHPQWGAVAYYEFGGLPVLHSLGYNNRSPAHKNLLLVYPPDAPFPYSDADVQPGKWTQARLPLRALAPLSRTDPTRHFDLLTFRVETPEENTLELKDLRLTGPAGEKVLDDFASEKPAWKRGEAEGLELATDPADGKREMRAVCPGARPDGRRPITFITRTGFDRTIDLAQYSEIRFTWRLAKGNPKWARPFILRVDNRDYQVPLQQLFAREESAVAETRDGDSYGRMTFTDWWSDAARWTRRMIVTREGILLVRDEFTPTPDQSGYTAGPLWHLFAPPTKGDHWFDATGDPIYRATAAHTFVWFAPSEEQSLATAECELWGGFHPHTVFAKQTITGTAPISFLTVIVPHPATTGAADLAHGITTDGAAVTVKLPTGALRLSLGADNWSVKRDGR